MSRSGYSNDLENWDMIRWRGAVAQAIRGGRGQVFLREMLAALDALPEKILISNVLVDQGKYCALGAVGLKRGMDLSKINFEDSELVAMKFGITHSLAAEIENINDECGWYNETPEKRWARVREWVVENIKKSSQGTEGK